MCNTENIAKKWDIVYLLSEILGSDGILKYLHVLTEELLGGDSHQNTKYLVILYGSFTEPVFCLTTEQMMLGVEFPHVVFY